MICSYCGHWNSDQETRCGHCGRRAERSGRETGGRAPAETAASSFSRLPPISRGRASRGEMPPPLPQWKKQLNLKLETYRSRQQTGKQAVAVAEQPPPENRPSLPPPTNVIAFQAPAPSAVGVSVETEPPPSKTHDWRRIEKAARTLPPLQRSFEDLINEQTYAGATDQVASGETPLPETRAPQAPDATLQQDHAVAPIQARVIAGVLDFSLVVVALGVFLGIFHTGGGTVGTGPEAFRTLAFAFLGLLFFYWIFYLRYVGETAGMTWMKLRVRSLDGGTPTPFQKWLRAGGTILSYCAAGLGFLWSVVDEDKLTWHDRMSRTYLTQLPPAPRTPLDVENP